MVYFLPDGLLLVELYNSNPSAWGHWVEVKLKCLSIRSDKGLWLVLAVTTSSLLRGVEAGSLEPRGLGIAVLEVR
jgi:hypothetical protein